MTFNHLITRRKSLSFCLGAPLLFTQTPLLTACSQQNSSPQNDGFSFGSKAAAPIKEGVYTETHLRLPYVKHSPGYKAPKGRFPVKSFKFDGKARQYHAYKASSPSSILLLLHGSNRNGASLIDKWQSLANRHRILLIAPDSLAKQGWSSRSDSIAFMQALIKHAKSAYRVGDVPLYGFGHSAGAIMMTRLSIRTGDMFTRIAVHAGYISDQEAMLSQQIRTSKPPLLHILGTKDHIFNVQTAKASAETLARYGQDVTLMTARDHNHWYYDQAPHINKKAWVFLTAKS